MHPLVCLWHPLATAPLKGLRASLKAFGVGTRRVWNRKFKEPPSIPPASQKKARIRLGWASFWNGGGIEGGTFQKRLSRLVLWQR